MPRSAPQHVPAGGPRRRRTSLVLAVALAASGLGLASTGPAATTPAAHAAVLPYQDAALPTATRVADLLGRMTVDDKIGQMTQAERAVVTPGDMTTYRLGSVLSGGGSAPTPNTTAAWADLYDGLQRGALATPLQIPMLYGIDAVHGNNNALGATIYPHNIGLGATRDPRLVQDIGRAVAEEVTATGVDWTFAPCLCVARDDRWGRTYESFGEDPAIASAMASMVTGFQGERLGGPASVLATAKHYLGDGGTVGGDDQGDVRATEAELRAVHLPPFRAAVERGVGSVMLSYSSWNGVKMHGNRYLLTDVLKGELGFEGVVVSDWAAIDQLDGARGFTAQEVATAVNAGLDMIMVPNDYRTFLGHLRQGVQSGAIPMSRVDDAVRRVLTQKIELGLFERPFADRSYASTVGSAAHRALARTAVQRSQVVLKNTGVLPLAPTGGKVCVAGRNAHDIGNQSGGWTLSWQGASGATVPGTTILEGVREVLAGRRTTTFAADAGNVDASCSVAVAVVGETPYAEGEGDRPNGLALDAVDTAALDRIRATGVPTVVVLVSGRPLDVSGILPWVSALDAAWLPGSEGAGVADVLFGRVAPTGTLPVSWPASATQQPVNDGDGRTPLFPLGAGLTWSVDGTGPTPSPTPTASPTPTPTVTPAPTLTPTPTATPSPTPPPTPTPTSTATPAACTAAWRTDNAWGSGFTATVTVRSTGTVPLRGWRVTWAWPDGTQLAHGWNATFGRSGATQTAANASWNGTLAPAASTAFGLQGTSAGAAPAPLLTCTAT
ncbi:glycoside hydrolase family 3 N-terminal domain-containing protein [Cellulomonas sp. NPDC057328]|uniref:glycoside hydrolase family 3 N-terminal domain-containing protein n=1 Tax=Cellulomonas sp. NPDC057328 TaxID=3346101 RepID=UPI0036424CA1